MLYGLIMYVSKQNKNVVSDNTNEMQAMHISRDPQSSNRLLNIPKTSTLYKSSNKLYTVYTVVSASVDRFL